MLIQTTPFLLTILLGAPNNAAEGRKIFFDPGLGKNGVSCADCHSTAKSEKKSSDGLIRAGHSLHGAAKRKYWRGDRRRSAHPSISDAVDVCVELFQAGAPLKGAERKALAAYLKSMGAGRQPAIKLEPALEADLNYDRTRYRGGDAEKGRAPFYKACHACHPHGGPGLGPAIAGKSLGDVARKIREGNGLLRGARKPREWMPFFGRDRLSDAQVADIAAYIARLPQAE